MKALWFALILATVSPAHGEAAPRVLTLPQAEALALEHNPQIRIASEQFLSAEGQALRLHAILYPTIDAQALTTPLTVFVQVQQTFYSHATLPQLRLSRLTREQAVLNHRQTLIDVLFQVRQAFVVALGAQEETDLDRRLISDRAAAVKTAQGLFEAGRAQRSDVLPLQVLVNLARQNESLTELGRRQSALALGTALGVDLPENIRLSGRLAEDGPGELDPVRLTDDALRDRADLKLLETVRLGAEQQVEIDRKNAWPIVGFKSDSAIQPPSLPGGNGFNLERTDNEPQTQRQAGDTQIPLSLYLSWSILDGGNLAGVRASDTAQIASQAVAIAALRRSIPGEIAAAVTAIEAERDSLRALGPADATATERQTAEIDEAAGRVRLLDKTNLETDIVRQQQLRLGSQIRLSLARSALEHALGHGVRLADAPPPPP